MTERDLKAAIRLALGKRPDVRLFNNPVGEAWLGRAMRMGEGAVMITGAQRVVYGVGGPGGGDLLGWRRVLITPEMVGQHLAQIVSCEVKGPKGRPTPEQINWREVVAAAGGRAGVVRSVDEAIELVGVGP